MLISAAYSVSGIRSRFSCSKTPNLEQIIALNLSDPSKLKSVSKALSPRLSNFICITSSIFAVEAKFKVLWKGCE